MDYFCSIISIIEKNNLSPCEIGLLSPNISYWENEMKKCNNLQGINFISLEDIIENKTSLKHLIVDASITRAEKILKHITNNYDIYKCSAELFDFKEIIEKLNIYDQNRFYVDKIYNKISNTKDSRITLLRNKSVIMWLFEDFSFLPSIEKKNKTTDMTKYKVLEDKWGQDVLKIRRPDLELDKQWTNKFGEHLCEEILIVLGKNVRKPESKDHYEPDLETDDYIWEIKTGTYFTKGTAHEKILGCPFKYAEVPELYSKPLNILCVGGAEKICLEKYGNLPGIKCSHQKKKFLDFFEQNNIKYISATKLLKTMVV